MKWHFCSVHDGIVTLGQLFNYLFIHCFFSLFIYFLVADKRLYKRLCPLVRPLARGDCVEKCKNERFKHFLCEFRYVEVRVGVWMGVAQPSATIL